MTQTPAAQRFEALRGHPNFSVLMEHNPGVAALVASQIVVGALGGAFAGMAYVVTDAANRVWPPEAFFGWAAWFFVGFGVLVAAIGFARAAAFGLAGVQARPALVMHRQSRQPGRFRGGLGRPVMVVTLAFENGGHEELETLDSVTAGLRDGDIGVAYIARDRLVDFHPVSV
jgi:hypothetical protein